MSAVIVKFTRAWGHYNTGEVAGFAPDQADKLIGKVAVAYTAPQAGVATLLVKADTAAVDAAFADLRAAAADLDQRAQVLERREAADRASQQEASAALAALQAAAADLAAREQALSDREAALAGRETALAATLIEEVDADGVVTTTAPAEKGAPPKQGGR